MKALESLPLPRIDALPLGAHRLSLLTDERLFEVSGVRVAFTGRRGGVSGGPYESLNMSDYVGDAIEDVGRNHQIVLHALGVERAALIMPKQVHGVHLVSVESPREIVRAQREAAEGADGIAVAASRIDRALEAEEVEEPPSLVDEKGEIIPQVIAMLLGADCPLVALVAPTGDFAVCHAGWRGAVGGIASKAARALERLSAQSSESFNAYIGPHICPECYEVGADVAQRFIDAFGPRAVEQARHVNLAEAISADLESAGLHARRIVSAGVCTKCESDRYFSYRGSGGTCGRHSLLVTRM